MNRKIFLTAGTLVLAVVSVFAGRMSMKKSVATSLGFITTGGLHCQVLFTSSIPVNFTTTTGSHQAQLKTVGGTQVAVYTSTCGKNVYFKG